MRRRIMLLSLFVLVAALIGGWAAWEYNRTALASAQTNVVTPDIPEAKYETVDGVKVFKLTAEPVRQEVSKGVFMDAWGYNGSTPGPTIVVRQGDRIKVELTNRLPEPTSIHWHGLIVPNEMDGVPGAEPGKAIQPEESYTYEFTVKQSGTFMYHSHVEPAKQEMMGLSGMFISLPSKPETQKDQKADRDYGILLQEWSLQDPAAGNEGAKQMKMDSMNGMEGYSEGQVPPGTYDVNPEAMSWNVFTFNGKQFPATSPMEVKQGDRVRIRIGNISMQNHPLHLHGHDFKIVAKDGSRLPEALQYSANTIDVAPGETYDVEYVADNPGTWVFHCHLPHHTAGMNGAEGGMLSVFHYQGTPWPPAFGQQDGKNPDMNKMTPAENSGKMDPNMNMDSMNMNPKPSSENMNGMKMSGN